MLNHLVVLLVSSCLMIASLLIPKELRWKLIISISAYVFINLLIAMIDVELITSSIASISVMLPYFSLVYKN